MNGKNLKEVLKEYEEFGGIGINWLFYGSSGHIERPKGNVIDNFLNRSEFSFEANKHIKTIVNPRTVDEAEIKHPHFFTYKEPFYHVDENKERIKENWPWTEQYSGNIIRMHHYYCKSKEDWAIKTKRGLNAPTPWHYTDEVFSHHDRNEVYDDTILKLGENNVR